MSPLLGVHGHGAGRRVLKCATPTVIWDISFNLHFIQTSFEHSAVELSLPGLHISEILSRGSKNKTTNKPINHYRYSNTRPSTWKTFLGENQNIFAKILKTRQYTGGGGSLHSRFGSTLLLYIRTVMYNTFIMVQNGDDYLYWMYRKTYTSRTYTLLRIKSVLNNTFTMLHKKFDFSSNWRGFDYFNPPHVSTKYCTPCWY